MHCPLHGKQPPTLTGTHNYVIDSFTSGTFPYAINQCTSTSIISTSKWYMYMCVQTSSGWMVMKKSYSNQNCTGTGTLVTTWTPKNYTNSVQGVDNKIFECSGVNSFAKLHISLSSDCSSSTTVYVGLAGCTASSAGTTQFEFFCNSSVAFVEFFRTANVSSLNQTTPSTTKLNMSSTLLNTIISNISLTSNMSTTYYETTTGLKNSSKIEGACLMKDYCEAWIVPNGKCTLANTTAFRNLGTKVYGELMSCQLNPSGSGSGGSTSTTSTTKTEEKGSTQLQLTISVIFTLFMAITWL